MKRNYEIPSRRYLTRRLPVIVRLDGRAFHSWTRGIERPFSQALIDTMVNAATNVSSDMQGFKLAYLQSDEVSFLLTDYDEITTEAWFGYVQSKVESIAASSMTAEFNRMTQSWYQGRKLALFDARAFNIPEAEIANYFLWRARDWERNSLNMYCSEFFSHKQLHGKSNSERHDMLHGIGKNWATDLTEQQKNGTWITGGRQFSDVAPSYPTIEAVVSNATVHERLERE